MIGELDTLSTEFKTHYENIRNKFQKVKALKAEKSFE